VVTIVALAATSISLSYAQNTEWRAVPRRYSLSSTRPTPARAPDQPTAITVVRQEPYNNNIWVAVTGYVVEGGNFYHAFVREPDGKIAEFDARGAGTTAGFGTTPVANNDFGVVAGHTVDNNNVAHGFVRLLKRPHPSDQCEWRGQRWWSRHSSLGD
jgi:hypothetical protein